MDKILLFRMGDFYEMFYEDAKTAAPILNIALTSRNKKSEDETPMCGMPHHSIAGPISKLVAAGLKIAICDQLEDPETAKGIVKRGVTRVLSPGLVYDPETLQDSRYNYLAAYDESTVSFLEASTGAAFFYKVAHAAERHIGNAEFAGKLEQGHRPDSRIQLLARQEDFSDSGGIHPFNGRATGGRLGRDSSRSQ